MEVLDRFNRRIEVIDDDEGRLFVIHKPSGAVALPIRFGAGHDVDAGVMSCEKHIDDETAQLVDLDELRFLNSRAAPSTLRSQRLRDRTVARLLAVLGQTPATATRPATFSRGRFMVAALIVVALAGAVLAWWLH